MQKVLQVEVSGTDRKRITLAEGIEKSIDNFISEVGGKLNEFVVSAVDWNSYGSGKALIVINYEPKANIKKEVK